jgi:hypothetical protein
MTTERISRSERSFLHGRIRFWGVESNYYVLASRCPASCAVTRIAFGTCRSWQRSTTNRIASMFPMTLLWFLHVSFIRLDVPDYYKNRQGVATVLDCDVIHKPQRFGRWTHITWLCLPSSDHIYFERLELLLYTENGLTTAIVQSMSFEVCRRVSAGMA